LQGLHGDRRLEVGSGRYHHQIDRIIRQHFAVIGGERRAVVARRRTRPFFVDVADDREIGFGNSKEIRQVLALGEIPGASRSVLRWT
jgi:hypothetical protein